ncbi:Hydrogenobyrinic acid a,c-diamide synthase (glutamine-hydrolyzing), partial [hydrothermal vent metagenome]
MKTLVNNSDFAKAIIIAAPGSGSGKTIFSMGLIAAMKARGLICAAAKTGPDYIDGAYLGLAGLGLKGAGNTINLDPWSMGKQRLLALGASHAKNADFMVIEGVMGLFDGAVDGTGSTADLAAKMQLPIVFVIDAQRQSHSVAALVAGFSNWRSDVTIGGLILNNVASPRHEEILRTALKAIDIPLLGVIPRQQDLQIPSRHLGLVLPGEIDEIEDFINRAGQLVEKHCDLDRIFALAQPLQSNRDAAELSGSKLNPQKLSPQKLNPLGQHIAIAHDQAFAFCYQHWLNDWRNSGSSVSFFSPLANEAPDADADAVFLPGGYPELFGEQIAMADRFFKGLVDAAERGALIYGECGGYMVLGKALKDREGASHKMASLLPHI